MVLSKDNIVVIEEIKTLELTSSQKRKLRRKKLKEAKSGSLNKYDKTLKDFIDPSKHPTINIEDKQEVVPKKKNKNRCDPQVLNKTGNSNFKETSLINNQEVKCETDLNTKTKGPVSNKKKKSPSKDIRNQESNGNTHSIANENKFPRLDTCSAKDNTTCGKLSANKKQKPKVNGNHKVNHDNVCLTENKKNKSDNSDITDKQSADVLKAIEKPAILPQKLNGNENRSPESKEVINDKIDLPSVNDRVLNKEELTNSSKSDARSTSVDNSETNSHKTEPIKEVEPLEKLRMGKIEDTTQTQKQKEGSIKIDLKKEDSTSTDASAKSREDIKAAREAKKLAKQKAKKKDDNARENTETKAVPSKSDAQVTEVKEKIVKTPVVSSSKTEKTKSSEIASDKKCKENIPPTDQRKTDDKDKNIVAEKSKDSVKTETTAPKSDEGKSKAELRAERRAKQEAQRAAKQESQRAAKPVAEQKTAAADVKEKEPAKIKEEKSPKTKSVEKSKPKSQNVQKVGWFQHLYVEKEKEPLTDIPINSNLHPAMVKLSVQLAERVVTGSNARCIALLDAIKKMVRDYSVPARTELGRGLQAQLAAAAHCVWARRAPTAAETNALKHVRRHLTQLPANVDEFDAKKQIQEEIDRYIREQIDMAGEAISLILMKKISPGDHILTYGCSSLIERALCAAWAAGVRFRATVAGARGQRGPEMLRRLRARGLPAAYVDISALSHAMNDVSKVVLGASALLAHGAALGVAGSAQAALLARARNVPVLVACETHKFSDSTHLDPLVTHDIGDPDELIDRSDPTSPLRDWRANPRLTLLNVTRDVTPPGLITAVVTELGILPCTSAPVVLRFKQAEYGM